MSEKGGMKTASAAIRTTDVHQILQFGGGADARPIGDERLARAWRRSTA